MAAVQERPPTVKRTASPPEMTKADLLFKEAKQRERRRRLAWLGVVVVVVGGAVAIVLAIAPSTKPPVHHAKVSTSSAPKTAILPTGSIVSLRVAGPLAVGPTGALYVADGSRHEVLVRLANGQFRVVAGDGRDGFAGDGGPATRAELSHVSDMAFSPNGDLYIADGSRVRVVDRDGTIRTIAGDGRSGGQVVDDTSALSARLGPVTAIAFSPSGELYLANVSQLFILSRTGELDSVQAILPPGDVQMPGILDSFGSIAVDSQGNVYASSTFDGWSVFKISPDGVAKYLGYARRSGGNTAIVQRGVNDAIEVDDGPNILHVEGDQLVVNLAANTVLGINMFIFTDYFALTPNGSIYADNLGPPAFEPYQQIVSVTDGHGVSLWRGVTRK